MKQVLAVRVGVRRRWGTLCRRGGGLLLLSTFRFDRRSGRRSPLLHWAGRRWVGTFKGRPSRHLPLDEPFFADHVQAKAGPGPIFGTFFGH